MGPTWGPYQTAEGFCPPLNGSYSGCTPCSVQPSTDGDFNYNDSSWVVPCVLLHCVSMEDLMSNMSRQAWDGETTRDVMKEVLSVCDVRHQQRLVKSLQWVAPDCNYRNSLCSVFSCFRRSRNKQETLTVSTSLKKINWNLSLPKKIHPGGMIQMHWGLF